ncbi:MAG: cobyric acid synthase, partial [Chloroflexota bacterium]
IVNMRVARYAEAPVLLVGDIDRGGVMAALMGTLDLLLPDERALVQGLIVNRFRGDPVLFRDGVTFLEGRTGLPVLGVVPHVPYLRVADEDSVALEGRPRGPAAHGRPVDVAVVQLPHIANFDDFAPLEAEPAAGVRYVSHPDDLGWPDLLILPGTKTTVDDLRWLRHTRLAERVVGLAASGAVVLGICGGYQMLGRRIRDPLHVESAEVDVPGLGLLPVETSFAPEKTTRQVRGRVLPAPGPLAAAGDSSITAYEIHMGQSHWSELCPRDGGPRSAGDELQQDQSQPREGDSHLAPAFLLEDGRLDGCVGAGGTIIGTYLHGLLDNAPLRRALLAWAARRNGRSLDDFPNATDDREAEYDRLAAVLRASLNVAVLYRLIGLASDA